MSADIATANDGQQLDLQNLAQSFTYSGSLVSTITVHAGGNTYVQTYTNDGTNVTNISGWIKQ